MSRRRMRIGIVEPHLFRFGGIRRMLEFANALVDRGHDVTFLLPQRERMRCTWMLCKARIEPIERSFDKPLDIVIANEETQSHLLSQLTRARRRVFYYLHASTTYGKPGSWEALTVPAHLTLANSTWTATRIYEASGRRPTVLLGGVNRSVFHVVHAERRYPILCVGDERPWKGTDTILQAGASLGLPVERYGPKNLRQEAMAREICSAEVFVVGSHAEGFCQPGLEALACGTPLVTTDNGGCREYAFHEETALVVPPGDPRAMADAIQMVRADTRLAARIRDNGLELAAERFSWPRATERLETLLGEVMDADAQLTVPHLRGAGHETDHRDADDPLLSIIVLAWDQLDYTQRCVQSIRQNTDVPYELIIVDNGSERDAAAYAAHAADVAVLNDENRGFAEGMNQGLLAARGKYVAFANNDTELPPAWASRLLEHFGDAGRAGIVVPAVTAAGNARTVRAAPGDRVDVIAPFEAPPSAVIYVMETETVRALEGWGEEYHIASAEGVDLCFKVWVNGLDIVFDERVLVEHVSKGTAGSKLDDWQSLWRANRQIFLDKWTGRPQIPRLPTITMEEFERNLAVASSVATWMRRYFALQRAVPSIPRRVLLRVGRPVIARSSSFLRKRRGNPRVMRLLRWAQADPRLARLRRYLG